MSKPVVVYGASGYTGRLVCEYLRELNLPFVAAGRDKGRLQAGLDTVPGLETAEYEIAEVAHSVDELTKLLSGARVLCNTVGPFMEYGPAAVEACYNAGVHYTDTTGEQDWLIWCKQEWGAKFAEKGLLLSPGIAQMYTVGEIAANYVLETPGIDNLDMAVFWKGTPTVASTATIVANAILSKAYFLEENKLVEWPMDTGIAELVVPGQHELGLALPWGGTSSPIWFQDDPRVSSVKVLGGVINRPLMLGVPQIIAALIPVVEGKSLEEKRAILAEQSKGIRSEYPPRENPRVNISIDSVHGTGPLSRSHCVIYGNCNYKQTGLLQAWAAQQLAAGVTRKTGFGSACQAFGHRELFGVLKSFGLVFDPVITVSN